MSESGSVTVKRKLEIVDRVDSQPPEKKKRVVTVASELGGGGPHHFLSNNLCTMYGIVKVG